MSDPSYYDFNLEMKQVGITLQAESDLLADKLQRRIEQMMVSGMGQKEIVAALKKDLLSSGPLFGGFSAAFKRAVNPVVDNVAQGALIAEVPATEREWEWVTTSVEPCDDCRPRHGLVKPYDEWRKLGLPRSGWSICGDNCKCVLVPAVQVGKSLEDGPVEADPLAKARADYQARLQSDPALQKKMSDYRDSLKSRNKR